jgi:hypothetical protein
MSEDKLAAVAAQDMLFPEIAFLDRERAIVIGRQHLGIGTMFGQRRKGAFGGRSAKGVSVNAS